ncbi:MAG: hypothetical protein WDN06_21905 [Asticcacaulis sp.]
MSEPDPLPARRVSEDRRRPRALAPYVVAWVAAVLCVIFAIVAMLNQV